MFTRAEPRDTSLKLTIVLRETPLDICLMQVVPIPYAHRPTCESTIRT